ncbi:hypothetical protein AB1283_20570 [Bacillus sp. S13(2024)]|uniref:hypothetical protein n=1 Tax=unclassified Bacillus (in: firmicutes) TaxID=185979 RepID=UPI003D1E079F
MKIHIVGGSGSGKTYIAKHIGEQFAVPVYDLDDVSWEGESFEIKVPKTIREQNLKEITSMDSWIIEGAYIDDWVHSSFLRADKIFILTPPLSLQETRIWDRYKQQVSGIEPSKRKSTEESIWELIEWNITFNKNEIHQFIRENRYKNKTIIVQDNLEIIKYMKLGN